MQKVTLAILAISVAALVIAVVPLLPQFRTVTFSDVGTEDTGIPARYQQPPDGKELTGNLTVYLLPIDLQKNESQDVIDIVLGIIGYVDAGHYSDFGASPQGQYADEKVVLTEQIISENKELNSNRDRFKPGTTVEMTVIKKPAESVKFYIDPAVTKPDGTAITRADLRPDYSFGNGISCCGFTLVDGTDVPAVIIVTDWAYDGYMTQKIDELKKALGAEISSSISVDVGGEPRQSLVQSGMGSSLMTKYLPVNITQTISLAQPTENITIYPVFADWDGIVRPDNNFEWRMYDEMKNPVPFTGFGYLSLHGVNATCTEPYFVKVKDTDVGEDGIKFENSTMAVSSAIYWGDTIEGSFEKPQSGAVSFAEGSYGIVPQDYNNNNDSTFRNNGAGNQKLSGIYHLSFTSFYPAIINLPKQVEMTSFLEVACAINGDSPHIQKSEFPLIYVYDVWFRVE